MNKKLYVVSGSSGVGKGTVLKEFLKKNSDFMLSISCTTRVPREGEIDGVNYFFMTKNDFKNCIDNDKFLEWAEFAGNFYGTKKKFINSCLEEGKNIILEIDTQGALQVKQKMPEAVLKRYEAMLEKEETKQMAQHMIENFHHAQSHPDAADEKQAEAFAMRVLAQVG